MLHCQKEKGQEMIGFSEAIDEPLEYIESLHLFGSPILRVVCGDVEYDPEIRKIAKEMIKVMYAFGGVGLAGPQVGFTKRIIVVDMFRKQMDPMVLINPVITQTSTELMTRSEGCLSLPGIYRQVARPINIVVDYVDINGEKQTLELNDPKVATVSAMVIQHEIDHLNGILIIDK